MWGKGFGWKLWTCGEEVLGEDYKHVGEMGLGWGGLIMINCTS